MFPRWLFFIHTHSSCTHSLHTRLALAHFFSFISPLQTNLSELHKKYTEERMELQQTKRKLAESESSLESARYEIQAMVRVVRRSCD